MTENSQIDLGIVDYDHNLWSFKATTINYIIYKNHEFKFIIPKNLQDCVRSKQKPINPRRVNFLSNDGKIIKIRSL